MTSSNVLTALIAVPAAVQIQLHKTLFWRADIRRSFSGPAAAFDVARTLSPDILVVYDDGGAERLKELFESLRRDPATHDCAVVLLAEPGRPVGPIEGLAHGLVLPLDFSATDAGARLEDLLTLRQRRENRINAGFPVQTTVALPEGGVRRLEATAVNVSSRGLLLSSPEALPRPARVELNFTLPGAAVPLAIVGEIVRTAQTDDGVHFAGVHFLIVRKEARVGIRDFLRTLRPAE